MATLEDDPEGKVGTVVPEHDELKPGTLKGVLKLAKVDVDEFYQFALPIPAMSFGMLSSRGFICRCSPYPDISDVVSQRALS